MDPTPATRLAGFVIREIFHSTQGEGNRAGSVNVFVRFAHCNLQCSVAVEGFNCDTDFQRGDRMTLAEVVAAVKACDTSPGGCGWVILTGGEPALQLTPDLCRALWNAGYKIAIETNGTKKHPSLDWVSVSPKPGSPCVLTYADECRIVLKAGQEPTADQLAMAEKSDLKYISPAFRAPPVEAVAGFVGSPGDLDKATADWCGVWVKAHPEFRISLQTHKFLGVR